MNITQKQKGILFMILSALSFASMQVVVRMSREIPTMEQICVRNFFILIVSFFIIRKNVVPTTARKNTSRTCSAALSSDFWA